MQIITKENSNFLKLIGALSMLIDHIGAFLYPQYIIFRIIGRISFPLFAYQISVSYQATSSKSRYLRRLITFGIISQYPYYLLHRGYTLNILFTFILAIWAMWAYEKKKYWQFFIIGPLSLFVDYGIYGILTTLGFYWFHKIWQQSFFFIFITAIYAAYYRAIIQWYSPLALILVYKCHYFKIKLPKYFFYIFYPAHLYLIYLIKIYLY